MKRLWRCFPDLASSHSGLAVKNTGQADCLGTPDYQAMANRKRAAAAARNRTHWIGWTTSWDRLIVYLGLSASALAMLAALMTRENARQPTVIWDDPRIWVQPGFLTDDESTVLIAELDAHTPSCWEAQPPAGLQATCSLEGDARSRPLAGSALMRAIDERIATALGVPLGWLEHGYVQRYRANYSAHNLHLDQARTAPHALQRTLSRPHRHSPAND